jgi:hypothetical protein
MGGHCSTLTDDIIEDHKRKKRVHYHTFEVVKQPSARFDEVRQRLAMLSYIAEPDDEFIIWTGSSILIGSTADGVIQAFVCVIDSDTYMDTGREWFQEQAALDDDFAKRGGLLDTGQRGGFLTSLCGNIDEYYGLGEGLLARLDMLSAGLDYLFLHVSDSKPTKDKLIKLYGSVGFEVLDFPYVETTGESFTVMRKMLK